MRLLASVLAVGLLLGGWATPAPAHAFEREWHLGIAGGVATGSGLQTSPALGAYAAYGLSDVFDVRAEVTERGYRFASEQDPHVLSAAVGLAYKLDVLRWVPWAGVYAGYLRLLEPPRAGLAFQQNDMLLGLGLGLDYGFSRHWGAGVTLRFDNALRGSDTKLFDALFRAEYRWGW
jgi:hypothetical protein